MKLSPTEGVSPGASLMGSSAPSCPKANRGGEGSGGVGLELPAGVLSPPREMQAPAVGGCPRKQLPINNGSSTCQEMVGREAAATEME